MMDFIKSTIKHFLLILGSYYFNNRKSKIIFYHDLNPQNGTAYTDMGTDFSLFLEHIKVITDNGFSIVSRITEEKNQVLIAFDDGWKGIYDHKDFLVNNNIFPTIFLAINLIGQEGYLNEQQILELQDLGFIFQSHSVSHDNLPHYNDDELRYELEQSKNILSNLLHKEVDEICFPQGLFSNRVLKLCREIGYLKMYSSLPGAYDLKNDFIYRNLCQFVSPKDLKYILFGGMDIFRNHLYKKHYNKSND